MLSAICFNLDQSKILSSGNGLNQKTKETRLQNCNLSFGREKALQEEGTNFLLNN